jgi:transposase-like protein
MKKSRKIYSKKFKQKAVELSNLRSNVQEIAPELGINAKFIYRWRRELANNQSLAFVGNGKVRIVPSLPVYRMRSRMRMRMGMGRIFILFLLLALNSRNGIAA